MRMRTRHAQAYPASIPDHSRRSHVYSAQMHGLGYAVTAGGGWHSHRHHARHPRLPLYLRSSHACVARLARVPVQGKQKNVILLNSCSLSLLYCFHCVLGILAMDTRLHSNGPDCRSQQHDRAIGRGIADSFSPSPIALFLPSPSPCPIFLITLNVYSRAQSRCLAFRWYRNGEHSACLRARAHLSPITRGCCRPCAAGAVQGCACRKRRVKRALHALCTRRVSTPVFSSAPILQRRA